MSRSERKRCGIYTRVSSTGQQTDSQEAELREFAEKRGWSVYKVYADHGISGTKESRPALDELMKDARQRRLDVVAVWKFDRYARSVKHLVNSLAEFNKLGVSFVSLTEQIDTTTPMGTMVFQVLGSVAELERSLIAQRTVAGLNEARRRGTRLGRPPAPELGRELIERIRKERAQGKLSLRQLAKRHSLPLWRVHRLCRRKQATVRKTTVSLTGKSHVS